MCWSLFLIKLQASRHAALLKRDSNTDVFLWILQTLRTPISKNICERLLLIAVIYCIENWITRFAFCLFWNIKSLYFTCSHSHSFVSLLAVIRGHLLSFFVTRCYALWLVVTRCHLLSLAIPLVVTHCHSLSFVVPLVAICCNSLYHSLSFVVTRCTTRLSFIDEL